MLRLASAAALLVSAHTAIVYVSETNGDDTKTGASAATAVKTLHRAASLASRDEGRATVHAAGHFALAAPLELGLANSGVTWLGDAGATISGGAPISGWKVAPLPQPHGDAADAPLPAVPHGDLSSGCAADYCANRTAPSGRCALCCAQKGNPAPPANICPQDKPFCAGYLAMKHYGACTATKPAPPVPMKVVTADVSALGAAAQDRHLYVNGARARRARLPVDVAATLFKGAKLTADGFTLGAPGKSTSIHPVGCDSQKKVFSLTDGLRLQRRCCCKRARSSSFRRARARGRSRAVP
jgi:hypothetical protein